MLVLVVVLVSLALALAVLVLVLVVLVLVLVFVFVLVVVVAVPADAYLSCVDPCPGKPERASCFIWLSCSTTQVLNSANIEYIK